MFLQATTRRSYDGLVEDSCRTDVDLTCGLDACSDDIAYVSPICVEGRALCFVAQRDLENNDHVFGGRQIISPDSSKPPKCEI